MMKLTHSQYSFFSLCLILLLGPFFLQAGDDEMHSLLLKKTDEYFAEAIQIRRHLHQIPEPCLKEKKTAAFISDYLKKNGLQVQTGIAGTGIKAILRGTKDHPVIGIRTDMDALPLTENTGLPFKSKHDGFMHACGHDGHMTNVLITARILSDIKDKIPGTIVFIFQPCEEGTPDGSPSGADLMIKAGALENPHIDFMLGLHVMPGYPAGSVALREGPIMANVASVYITLFGKSSHGAFPHQGKDAIYAAALTIVQFQSVISRSKDPNENAVLTIGKISGGSRLNIIADQVQMEGTVRSFSFKTENLIEEGMERILKALEIAMDINYRFDFKRVSQFVYNNPQLTAKILPLFKKILGDDHVHITEPMTIGEDFSAYSHQIPSLFFFLGVGETGTLHSTHFSIDEESLRFGPLLLSAAALELLNNVE